MEQQNNDTAGATKAPAGVELQDDKSPEEKQDRLPFDKAALNTMRAAANTVIATHPEVRSVVVVLDYAGNLNDVSVDKGLWIGEDGAVSKVDAVHGSIGNTVAVLEQLFLRAASLAQGMREQVVVLGNELVKRRTELEQLNAKATEAAAPVRNAGAVGWPDHFWYDNDRNEIREGPNALSVYATAVCIEHLTDRGYVKRDGQPSPVGKDRFNLNRYTGWWELDHKNPITWPNSVFLEGDELYVTNKNAKGSCWCAGVTKDALYAAGFRLADAPSQLWLRNH